MAKSGQQFGTPSVAPGDGEFLEEAGSAQVQDTVVLFAWIAFDIFMLTPVICRGDGPRSALIPGYFLLIAGTGLRLRIYLVWFATSLCLAGYFSLLFEAYWQRPEFAVDLKECMITVLSMAALGLIQYILSGEWGACRREQ